MKDAGRLPLFSADSLHVSALVTQRVRHRLSCASSHPSVIPAASSRTDVVRDLIFCLSDTVPPSGKPKPSLSSRFALKG